MGHHRQQLRLTGVVQGVGFRPFVHRLAHDLRLAGRVGNDATGVFVEVEGDGALLDRFAERLVAEHPPLARIDAIDVREVAARHEFGFSIAESSRGPVDGVPTLVPPDVATCDDCLDEVDDPSDRRYRYPFTNCTNCGPRFTIIRELPYDRPSTTMAGFEMCASCEADYTDPADRRYHAQPIACPECGPRLAFDGGPGPPLASTDGVIAAFQSALTRGEVVAVKGLGGYHLACDALSDAALTTLRERKGRPDKPFAVMVPDLDAVARFADPSSDESAALTDPARPIVLLRRADGPGNPLSPLVAPGNPLVGIMLPSTPLHHLLFRPVPDVDVEPPRAIVLTSGNRSDEPICFDDDDARRRLTDLADAFCTHDRPIEVPCDDSVVRIVDGEVQPIRRSRGYAPMPVSLPFDVPPVVGVGGELKNTCCVAVGRHAWVGQHIGDMENLETLAAFDASVDAFTRMYGVAPVAYGVDLHPGYLSRRWALDRAAGSVVDVQHHHAHVAALMAEHGLDGSERLLGFAFDGTGFGRSADGAVQMWGGEVLLADYARFERVGHLAPLPLPGGDAGVLHPCRTAVAYLAALGLPHDPALPSVAACDPIELGVVRRQVERDVGCVPTTSMGRLFDVVASLLGVRHRISYEAQAAIELEALACSGRAGAFPLGFAIDPDGVIDPAPVLAGIVRGMLGRVDPADLASAFHTAVADVIGEVAAVTRGRLVGSSARVGLTGGVFQNALLTQLARERLERDGFEVLTHRLVPPNDGGLSLGQAIVAGVHARDAAGGTR